MGRWVCGWSWRRRRWPVCPQWWRWQISRGTCGPPPWPRTASPPSAERRRAEVKERWAHEMEDKKKKERTMMSKKSDLQPHSPSQTAEPQRYTWWLLWPTSARQAVWGSYLGRRWISLSLCKCRRTETCTAQKDTRIIIALHKQHLLSNKTISLRTLLLPHRCTWSCSMYNKEGD